MSLSSNVASLATRIATEFKAVRASMGTLGALNTTDKTTLVAAINEVNVKPVPAPPTATTAAQGIVELATLAEVAAGTDTTRVVTVEGVRQERIALRTEILGSGVPAALDTLDELAAALGDDANFATTVTTGLANRVRVDTAAQALTTVQQGNARTNIDAASATAVGSTTTDYVATFEAGLI